MLAPARYRVVLIDRHVVGAPPSVRDQTVTLALWIRTLWEDPRLAWNSSCVPEGQDLPIQGSPVGRVWVPSVFVENWREAPKRIEGAWWLSREGRVWWSRKEYWQLMCEMDFSLMPFDNQTCWARLSTYVHSRALTLAESSPFLVTRTL